METARIDHRVTFLPEWASQWLIARTPSARTSAPQDLTHTLCLRVKSREGESTEGSLCIRIQDALDKVGPHLTHPALRDCNTKGYSSTYLAMGFANVRAGTQKRLVRGWTGERRSGSMRSSSSLSIMA